MASNPKNKLLELLQWYGMSTTGVFKNEQVSVHGGWRSAVHLPLPDGQVLTGRGEGQRISEADGNAAAEALAAIEIASDDQALWSEAQLGDALIEIPEVRGLYAAALSGGAGTRVPEGMLERGLPAVPGVEAPAPVDDVGSGHVMTSPFVGTFYRAPAPDDPPFSEVGQRVTKGQTLCIVEAMKLMNEIEADVSGVVKRIFVENAQPVEYDQKLFVIQPD